MAVVNALNGVKDNISWEAKCIIMKLSLFVLILMQFVLFGSLDI